MVPLVVVYGTTEKPFVIWHRTFRKKSKIKKGSSQNKVLQSKFHHPPFHLSKWAHNALP